MTVLCASRARGPALLLFAAFIASLQQHYAHGATPHAYDSIIKTAVRSSVYWQVTNTECTAVHTYNVSSGEITWMRSPVDPDQNWGTQVTDKRTFYTLEAGGPQVSAVTLAGGQLRWTWPDRVGFPLWQHWDTDLPQSAALDYPLPAMAAQQLLVRLKGSGTKLLGLDLYNGTLLWELDVAVNISSAAHDAGLNTARSLSISSWLLDPVNSTVYVAVQAREPPATYSTSHYTSHSEPRSKSHLKSGSASHSASQPAADGVDFGWVVAVDLAVAAAGLPGVQWVAGPLEQGPVKLTLTEAVLLAASQADAAGSGWLYGVHKVSGAALYSLPCAGGPCKVQVVDTRLGLLTASLQQQPPSLDGLAAFELSTGKVLWRGVQGSGLQPFMLGDCTQLTDLTLHTYVACTCSSAQAAAARTTGASNTRSAAQEATATGSNESGKDSLMQGLPQAIRGHSTKPAATHGMVASRLREEEVEQVAIGKRRPRPRPDPQPGPGLCGFAFSTATGKLGFEVILSPNDSVPVGAAQHGLAPFVMADTIVFPGSKGIYAMQRLSHPQPQPQPQPQLQPQQGSVQQVAGQEGPGTLEAPGGSETDTAQQQQQLLGASQRRMVEVPAHPLISGVLQPAAQAGLLSVHAKPAAQFTVATAGPIGASAAAQVGAARQVFTFPLPQGVVLQPWDWLDLKSGVLILHASPHLEDDSSTSSPPEQDPAVRSMQHSTHSVFGFLRRWQRHNGLNKKKDVDEPPQTKLFALDPVNGTLLWSLGLDVWVGPLSPHALQHEWGRGSVLLLDGCRPPVDDGGILTDEDGSGTQCCLHAVSLANGTLLWQNCYDMDRACASGLARRTATLIVYLLLAAQVAVLVGGFALGLSCYLRRRRTHAATIMMDPDSEDEALVVQVLPGSTGYNLSTS